MIRKFGGPPNFPNWTLTIFFTFLQARCLPVAQQRQRTEGSSNNNKQSCAIAKMTARCALYMAAWKFSGLPDYTQGFFSQNFSWAFVPIDPVNVGLKIVEKLLWTAYRHLLTLFRTVPSSTPYPAPALPRFDVRNPTQTPIENCGKTSANRLIVYMVGI